MSTAPAGPDPAKLLAELGELPAERRAERARAVGASDAVLTALADEVEKLAVTEVSRALVASELVLELADSIGGSVERARARRARGQSLAYAGRFEDALAAYREAIQLADEAGAEVEAARARMSSMHALHNLGRLDESIAAGEAAQAAFVEAGETQLAAKADSNLGATHRARDNPKAALVHFDRARPHFEHEPVALAQVDSNRAQALLELDRFGEAEQSFQLALPTFVSGEMHWAAAIVEGNLAELATRQGRLQPAMYHFERARRHLEKDEAQADLARLLAEQAEALLTLGLLDEAGRTFERALPALDEHEFALEAVRARAGYGQTLVRQARMDEAEPLLAEAAAGYEKLGHNTARARLDLIRAELASARGRPEEAERLVEGAVAALRDRPMDAAVARYHRARLHLDAGRLEAAEKDLDEAVAVANELGVGPLLADVLQLRARLHRARGRPAEAAADLHTAVEHIEHVRGALQAERFRAAFLGNRLTVYEDLVVALLDGNEPESIARAFAVVERAKGRSLLDTVGGTLELPTPSEPETSSGESELWSELDGLRSELNALYSRLADAQFDEEKPEAALQRRKEIQTREQALAALESRLATTRGVAALFAPPIELDAARERLPKGAALIEYFIAGDELLAFVISAAGTGVFRRLCDAKRLSESVERVHFQLRRAMRPGAADGPRGERLLHDIRRELADLERVLIAPLRNALQDCDRLTIVPHGPLHALPFPALWDGERSLIEEFDIAFAPSASLLSHIATAARDGQSAGTTLVVGVSDELAPRTGEEARQVAETLGADHLLIDDDATVARVREKAAHADVLHIASHGHFSAESPLASGIKLADGWLTVRDIFELRLRASLVTLSGCETGRNVVAAGDELVGLVRGFFAAGAAAMIVSLWTVSDASTADLMSSFYRAWRYNTPRMGISSALRAGQLELMALKPHPVFWAPFVLIGAT